MALQDQLEKNKTLIAIIAVAGLGIGFAFWNFYLTPQNEVKKIEKKELTSKQLETININFDVLEGDYLKELQLIGSIPEYQGQIGKDNPFIKQ